MNFDIVLKHQNGERKTVPVEYVAPSCTYLTIRWELAGLYDLNLSVNVLTARSAEGQAKGKGKWYKKDKPQWRAEDIVAVRKMARDYLAEKRGNPKAEREAEVARHVASMPNPRIGEHPTAQLVDDMLDISEPFPHYEGDPDIEDEIA